MRVGTYENVLSLVSRVARRAIVDRRHHVSRDVGVDYMYCGCRLVRDGRAVRLGRPAKAC